MEAVDNAEALEFPELDDHNEDAVDIAEAAAALAYFAGTGAIRGEEYNKEGPTKGTIGADEANTLTASVERGYGTGARRT
eukprot:704133-Ditylum_brightwellii.AAC.1